VVTRTIVMAMTCERNEKGALLRAFQEVPVLLVTG
jgi:hypothetical protein